MEKDAKNIFKLNSLHEKLNTRKEKINHNYTYRISCESFNVSLTSCT